MKKEDGGRGERTLPYSEMYLVGLKLGFTTEDMRRMPFTRLAMFIMAYNEHNGVDDGGRGRTDGIRDATQNDIDRLMGG